MAWLAVDKDGTENIYDFEPNRDLWVDRWEIATDNSWWIELPKGTIEKIIGRTLIWPDVTFMKRLFPKAFWTLLKF